VSRDPRTGGRSLRLGIGSVFARQEKIPRAVCRDSEREPEPNLFLSDDDLEDDPAHANEENRETAMKGNEPRVVFHSGASLTRGPAVARVRPAATRGGYR